MGWFVSLVVSFVIAFAAFFLVDIGTTARPLSPELQEWERKGRYVDGPGGHKLFVVDHPGGNGSGRVLLIAHGFPTSSYEWREQLSRLAPHFSRVVLFDYIGFGFSDKPVLDAGAYSVPDHADTLQQVLNHLKSDQVELLCHDMSDSVCSELIARGSCASVKRVTFLNGGMRWRLANLRLSQKILLSPLGRLFGKLPIEWFFRKQIRTLFVNQSRISDDELADWFTLILHKHGFQNMHLLIEYIRDRHRFEPRWTR